ncbi:diguanylate cyclase domain-containing protein [Vibrio viridaestus]|uniref:diguanylate cyclase n=1 Tax=Vibrio viridaestus TaxID=2487322 RepID=A0A3N9U7Z7_9VIBR|nr:diguanylate cyclase [Vibrio viridaestus]RQW64306.1 diguanylate cyclase [Vibrio viridaestus]
MSRGNTLKQLSANRRKPVLLLVDDQRVNIFALNALFEDDYDVLMATDGEAAIKLVRDQMPDAVLLDINMPGMDGYEVCRILTSDKLTEDIPIIFVTGETDSDVEAHGFEIGASDFITKPFNPTIVRARVLTHVLLKLQRDVMKDMAMIDVLTGLSNRRKFDDALEINWKLCLREKRPLTLLMLDVDYFKKYNDHYGHIEGDKCLQLIGKALSNGLRRPADVCSRYGGEEFACLLPFTDETGASLVAESILKNIHDTNIPHVASDIATTVTASIGICTLIPQTSDHTEILLKADEALYLSKQRGRNRYSFPE